MTEEALADVPQMQGYIRELLRYDLKLEEENQILKGDGIGENLNGLMTQATIYDANLTKAGDTSIDIVRRGIYQVRKQSKLSADGVVMSELDWMNIELQRMGKTATCSPTCRAWSPRSSGVVRSLPRTAWTRVMPTLAASS